MFGDMQIDDPGGAPVNLPGRRERVVLAFLALAPEFKASRRNLIELLWGDKADDTTLDNLRTCLWSLRKSLGEGGHDLILSDRSWVRLNHDLLEVDLWRFCELAKSDDSDDLEQAAALFSGELLEGLDLASDEFADWIRGERDRLTEIRLDVLSRLLQRHQESGGSEAGLSAGQEILRLDPYNETALRGVMTLYAVSGRRNMALQTYQRFAETLERDLGVEPEAETRETFQALSQSNGSGTAVPPAGADAASPQAPKAPTGPSPLMRALRIPLWAFAGAATIALLALIVTGVIFWRVPALAPPMVSGWISGLKTEIEGTPPSIAVLPFRGHGDRSAETYAAAISDIITSTLSQTSNMVVISRSSVERYHKNPPPAPVIAQQLGVRYLLEGSITKFGDSVTVQVGLIDTFEGEKTIPIGAYEKKTSDFFSLRSEITLKVVTALRVRLTEGEEERISQAHGTQAFQAWLLATKAQKQLRQFTVAANQLARQNYLAAIAADPTYAGAWTGLSWTHLVEARFGWVQDRAAALRKSAELAKKSLALDDRRAGTYALLGTVALFAGKYDIARQMGERSVELEYNDADSAALYALTLTYTGQPRKARNLIERAIRLRPYPPRWYNWLLARTYRLAGRPSEAIDILTASSRTGSQSIMPLVELALAYSQMGAMIQGRAAANEIRQLSPRFSASNWLTIPSYEDPDDTRRDLKALRDVGLQD
jgi:DNA-binding SARP family transcriptional activator/TolB-like protein/Flp pilus assembly protein TadD